MTAGFDGPVEVCVLDVGHGNSTIIRCDVTVVVDAPPGRVLPDELDRTSTQRVEHVVLSHADKDHVGGAVGLLSSKTVSFGQLWFSPDASKDTAVWEDLRHLAYDLHLKGRLDVSTALNAGSRTVTAGDVLTVEIAYPDIGVASTGPRAATERREAVAANSMSAVLRVLERGNSFALLPGDLDTYGLQRLLDARTPIDAPVLVFPHHGGRSGGDDEEFARNLCLAVRPSYIVFSLSRSRFQNPRLALMRGVRAAASWARILCTQLSPWCSNRSFSDLALVGRSHLTGRPAAGITTHATCAGTIVATSMNGTIRVDPDAASHQDFIRSVATSALCSNSDPSSETFKGAPG